MIQAEVKVKSVDTCYRDSVLLEMAVRPSTLGELEVTLLKILISTRNIVTRSVMRPGTISGGIKNPA